jgi:hypothetical protein
MPALYQVGPTSKTVFEAELITRLPPPGVPAWGRVRVLLCCPVAHDLYKASCVPNGKKIVAGTVGFLQASLISSGEKHL